MTRPPLDPARGAEAARELKSLGAKRILIKAAELGYITQVACAMPKCFCPEELGGRPAREVDLGYGNGLRSRVSTFSACPSSSVTS